jgi:beta-glucosidase
MPGLGRGDDGYVLEGVRSGALPEKALDASVGRVLELARRYGRGDGRQRGGAGTDAVIGAGIDAGTRGVTGSDLAAHHLLARRAAAAGTVLLRNEGGVLPLRRGVRVAVIGEFARRPRFQGAGSSHVVPTRVDTLFGALTEALGASWVTFAPGYDTESDESAAAQLAEAVRVAESADVAIVVVGLPEVYETEGVDRDHLRLPAAHDRLVEAVRAVNPGTVVVLQNGSPVELPWRGDVAAIVEGYLGGQAGGSALADVLIGVAEPGGRLAETFPVRYADHAVSSLPNGPAAVEYRESLYVGYRWFDSADERVAFPFGHGLSYASFEWSDVTTSTSGPEAGDRVTIELTVTNTSDRRGSEVVQVYVHDVESSMFRPEQELKGFAKVELDAGASERVSIELDRRAFSFWQTSGRRWTLEPGDFEIRVGRSSRDILWRTLVGLGEPAETAGAAEAPLSAGPSPAAQPAAYRAPSRKSGFTVADFEALLGRPVPANVAAPPGEFTLDTALTDMQLTWVGRLLFAISRRQALKALGAPSTDRVHAAAGDVVAQVTFRMFPTVTEGVVGRRRTLQLLRLVNRLSRRR